MTFEQSVIRRTSKCSRDKDGCEAPDASDKRSSWDMPVLASNVVAIFISSTVDDDSEDDEDLYY
jgi:hypothetical protein